MLITQDNEKGPVRGLFRRAMFRLRNPVVHGVVHLQRFGVDGFCLDRQWLRGEGLSNLISR